MVSLGVGDQSGHLEKAEKSDESLTVMIHQKNMRQTRSVRGRLLTLHPSRFVSNHCRADIAMKLSPHGQDLQIVKWERAGVRCGRRESTSFVYSIQRWEVASQYRRFKGGSLEA